MFDLSKGDVISLAVPIEKRVVHGGAANADVAAVAQTVAVAMQPGLLCNLDVFLIPVLQPFGCGYSFTFAFPSLRSSLSISGWHCWVPKHAKEQK